MAVVVVSAAVTPLGCGDDEHDAGQASPTSSNLGLIQKDTLIVGSEIPFPPFEEGEAPDYEGFDIDVINAVAEDLDLEVQIEDVPLNTIVAGVDDDLDLSISAVAITPAREKRVDFSNPYFIDFLSLLVRDDEEIQSVDDITADAVIGVEDATKAESYAREETDASEVRAFATAGEASNALLSSDVDAVIVSGPAAEEAIGTRENLSVADSFPTREAYGIVLPEGSDALRRAVNSALKELREEETLTDLYDEYFGVEAPARVATPIREQR
jgi:polar amino acid transport system substrate-binding protein